MAQRDERASVDTAVECAVCKWNGRAPVNKRAAETAANQELACLLDVEDLQPPKSKLRSVGEFDLS